METKPLCIANLPDLVGRYASIGEIKDVDFKKNGFKLVIIYSYTWGRAYLVLGIDVGGVLYAKHVLTGQRKCVWSKQNKGPPQVTLKGET